MLKIFQKQRENIWRAFAAVVFIWLVLAWFPMTEKLITTEELKPIIIEELVKQQIKVRMGVFIIIFILKNVSLYIGTVYLHHIKI